VSHEKPGVKHGVVEIYENGTSGEEGIRLTDPLKPTEGLNGAPSVLLI
jgi:hypothetical protein